ncbi:type VI secretion protein [Streptomyces pathocidini]|uniref:Type VI secretion protein n=1 Tax=Streptomyces pathocidini TaxID=1650571 RepID=A0ABW7UWX7_9ACTN|nr:hypothetical protein [Streptomyces pathocidini]
MASGSSVRGVRPGSGSDRGIPDGLLLGLLGFLLGLTVLVWTATGLAGLFSHGAWPEGVHFTHTPLAMRHLAAQPHNLPAAWPQTPPDELSGYGLFWGLLIGELMVLIVLTVFAIGTITRWRATRARARAAAAEARFAPPVPTDTSTAPEATDHSRPAPADHAAPRTAAPVDLGKEETTNRSQVPNAHPADVAHTPEQPRSEAQHPLLGLHFTADGTSSRTGTQAGARRELALQAIRSADGPLLVVTSDPALWSESKEARAKLGPTHLYDPSHLLDTPARLRWSPTTDCESRDIAAARAAALLAPVRPANTLDSAMADAAETLLRSWLHAAAVDGQPFRQVHRWASGGAAHDAVRILRTHPKAAPGAAGELEATLTAHPERREIAQQLTARALSALSSIHIRNACNPTRADTLALESFVAEGGTLYVMGEAIEDPRAQPGAMPLLTALASSVVEHGRRMAERSSDGRLDPPLTLVLDDIASVAPLPQLPELLAEGPLRGLPTLALIRSEEQAKARWLNTPLG